MNLCLALAWAGKAEAAQPILAEFEALEKPDAEIQLKVARAWSSLARNSEGDEQAKYRTAALKALQRAIEEGYSDPFKVSVEPEFHWLKDAADFKRLVSLIK